MTFKIQCLFNNQKWGNELERLTQAKKRIEQYSRGNLTVEFLPSMYTTYKEIPSVIQMFPLTSETADTPDPLWYLDNIYPKRPTADALVLITNRADWWDKNPANYMTYGYCSNHHPPTLPPFISIMAEPDDRSFMFSRRYALEHYLPHELGHAFCNITGVPDSKVHELDYAGKIQELYDLFDYSKIEFAINNKRNLIEPMYVFTKEGDSTIYFAVGKVLVPFANTYEGFLADFKDAIVVKLAPDEFLKFKIANSNVVKAR